MIQNKQDTTAERINSLLEDISKLKEEVADLRFCLTNYVKDNSSYDNKKWSMKILGIPDEDG